MAGREAVILDRRLIGAISLATALVLSSAAARAFDETKYPDLRGQWIRIGPGQYDSGKPPGPGQQAPLTPLRKGQPTPDLKYFK
jgi:hypothetical protein